MPVEAPAENFARGIKSVDLSGLGHPTDTGKVRDIMVVDSLRVMVTSDRTSAYDSLICTVPGKGGVLNLLSEYWFKNTVNVVPNHMESVPHPNILIGKQAEATLPVEVVLRRYMARSSTSTSIYYNYVDLGRRNIYGIDFPGGLVANQEFPMGTVLTPTTKAESGHDEELTNEVARDIVNGKLGPGIWQKTKAVALEIFERGRAYHLNAGLILVDTKYEFGVDKNGDLMLIDEVHTPDSSRFWLYRTYQQKFEAGETPETFDKEILRRWLADNGYTGKDDQEIPIVDPAIIDQMADAYKIPHRWVTGSELPDATNDPIEIREIVSREIDRLLK